MLGTRTGNEKKNDKYKNAVNPFSENSSKERGDVVVLSNQEVEVTKISTSPLHQKIQEICAVDPTFKPDEFLKGAEKAFRLILKAYAKNETNILKNLVSEELCEKFKRPTATKEIIIHSLESDIEKIEVINQTSGSSKALITVWFKTHQSKVDQHKDEASDSNSTSTQKEAAWVVDLWVFEKDLKNEDPIWKLARMEATSS